VRSLLSWSDRASHFKLNQHMWPSTLWHTRSCAPQRTMVFWNTLDRTPRGRAPRRSRWSRWRTPEKVRRKVYTGSSSRDLLFSESSVLNIILRRLLGLRTPHRSYTKMRVICLDCDARIRRRRVVVPLVILGVMILSLFAFVRYEASSGDSYELIDRGNR
jgi:hypothetical protein